MIVAFDFDNTLFQMNQGLQIGQPIPATVNLLKRLYEEGHTVIIYSGRKSEEIQPVLDRHHIRVHRINSKEVEQVDIYKTPSGKPYYHVFIDDKNLNPLDKTETELYQEVLSLGMLQQNLEHLQGHLPKNENISYEKLQDKIDEMDWKKLAAAGVIGATLATAPMTADAQAHQATVQTARPSLPSDLWKGLTAEDTKGNYDVYLAIASVVRNRLAKGMSHGLVALKRKDLDAFVKRETDYAKTKNRDLEALTKKAIGEIQAGKDTVDGADHYEHTGVYPTPSWAKQMKIVKVLNKGTKDEITFYRSK